MRLLDLLWWFFDIDKHSSELNNTAPTTVQQTLKTWITTLMHMIMSFTKRMFFLSETGVTATDLRRPCDRWLHGF